MAILVSLRLAAITAFGFLLSFVFTGLVFAQSGAWTSKTPMPTARHQLGVGSVNGIVYALGGIAGGCSAYGTVEAYDPATDSWTAKAPMPTPRYDPAVGVVNGILYTVGGSNFCGTTYSSVEAYDPTTNLWTAKAPMPTPRKYLGVGVVNGILYAVGGTNEGTVFATVEAYDPATNTWTTKASLPMPRGALGVAVVNGVLYAVGGGTSAAGSTTVEAYDPATNTWTSKAPMPTARNFLSVAVVNGILYAIGGQNEAGQLATVEAYDPVTDSWRTDASMPAARGSFGAGVVNGVVYAVGGFRPNIATAANEAFTPAPPSDTVAPTTTASANPAANSAGWNNSSVTVTLTATDGAGSSGVQSITYTINGGAPTTAPGASTSFAISAEGVNTISYSSTDNVGNVEASHTLVVRIDQTAPVLSLPGTITANATSPAGAVVTYAVTATDNSGLAPSVACAPASGSTFTIGTSTVSCTATDAAGKSSSGNFTVTVLGSSEQTTVLIGFIDGLGLPGGTANSLTSTLDNAMAKLASGGNVTAACNMLDAFINQGSAQSGKQLTVAQASQLIHAANQIRATQGCQ